VDVNSAFVRSTAILSFAYEKEGEKDVIRDKKRVHTTFFERQSDGSWKVSCKMWDEVI
jgi:ketosteroid isomerase-like protein